jgi:PAS domain S-box-containing protein
MSADHPAQAQENPGSAADAGSGAAAATQAEPAGERVKSQELFEFAAECEIVTDSRGVIWEANHAAAALFKCRREFLFDTPLGLFVAEGQRQRFYGYLIKLRESPGTDQFEIGIGRKGVPRDVLVRVSSLGLAVGHPAVFRWQMRDITEWRQAELTRTDLLHRLVAAQERERRQIARELHDELGQQVTALILELKLLGDSFPPESSAQAHIEHVRRATAHLGRSIHRLAVELRPAALDDLGLEPALRNYLAEWSSRTGIRTAYQSLGLAGRGVRSPADTDLYRIVQEALTNVAKHSHATNVSVILERREHCLRLIVEDNGRGFDIEAVLNRPNSRAHLGMVGMRERVALIRGLITFESQPGGPTSVFVEVPIAGGTGGPRDD